MTFWDLFQNPDGSLSSRRVFGAVIVIFAIVGMSIKLFDSGAGQVIIGIGGVLLMSTAGDQHGPGGRV